MDKWKETEFARWLVDRRAIGLRPLTSPVILLRARRAFYRMLGARFGQLVVGRYEGLHTFVGGHAPDKKWRCVCACNAQIVTRGSPLLSGESRSCGACHFTRPIPNWGELTLRKVALSFEFEGSIGVYKITPLMVISVRGYSGAYLESLWREVGIGTYGQEKPKGNAVWTAAGVDAINLSTALLPYLVTKAAQARCVSDYPLGQRNKRVTQEMRQLRAKLHTETLGLNRRGPKLADPGWSARVVEWVTWAERVATEAQRMELLAACIEFEGALGVRERVNPGSARGLSHGVYLNVAQATYRVGLLEIVSALAGGLGRVSSSQEPPREGWSPMSGWWVTGTETAKRLARGFHPYMLTFKQRLAELIAEYPDWGRAPMPVPAEMFARRSELAAESKALNACDPPPPALTPP